MDAVIYYYECARDSHNAKVPIHYERRRTIIVASRGDVSWTVVIIVCARLPTTGLLYTPVVNNII